MLMMNNDLPELAQVALITAQLEGRSVVGDTIPMNGGWVGIIQSVDSDSVQVQVMSPEAADASAPFR